MEFRVLPPTPDLVSEDGIVHECQGDSAPQVPLAKRYRALLRLFLVSAAVRGQAEDASVLGVPVTKRIAAEVLGGSSPQREVPRAVMHVRQFLTESRGRPPAWSESLGGRRGRADGGGRRPTDEAFITTVDYDGQTAYRFLLNAGDTIDWSRCIADIADASQAFAAGDAARARALAKPWRTPLDDTDLDLAFDFPINNIWQE